MMPKMVKPSHKPIDVPDEQVPNFEAAGFKLMDPNDKPAEPGAPDLSDAEIAQEVAAVKKVETKKAKDAGDDDETAREKGKAAADKARKALKKK